MDPVGAKAAKPLGELVVAGGDHAALGGGDRLDRVEREAGHVRPGAVADRPVGGRCTERLGGVLDDHPRTVGETGEIDRQAGEVHRDQRARPSGTAATSRLRVSGSMSINDTSAPT